MPAISHTAKEIKRINLSLPVSLYDELSEVVQEEEMTYTAVIRQAVTHWLDQRTKVKMAEGYKALAQENLDLLVEFKHVEEEAW